MKVKGIVHLRRQLLAIIICELFPTFTLTNTNVQQVMVEYTCISAFLYMVFAAMEEKVIHRVMKEGPL